MAQKNQQGSGKPEEKTAAADGIEKKPIEAKLDEEITLVSGGVKSIMDENAELKARLAEAEAELARRAEGGRPPRQRSDRDDIEVKVVSNYGGKFPGDIIKVSRAEYQKFRKLDPDATGGFRCPVFISEEDETTQLRIEAERKERELAERQQRDEAARGDGWNRYQQESMERVRAMRLQEQESQRRALVGGENAPTPEERNEKFRNDMRRGRGD